MLNLNIATLLVAVLVAGFHFAAYGTFRPNPYGVPNRSNQIVLYSLEDCGHSDLKRIQFRKQELQFEEVFPVSDREQGAALKERMVEAGYDFEGLPLAYHLPLAEVNGHFLSRPSIGEVWKKLRYY